MEILRLSPTARCLLDSLFIYFDFAFVVSHLCRGKWGYEDCNNG